jgi:hypothetical protein
MRDINQTSLVFVSNSTYEDNSTTATVTITYKDGVPTYADFLTALVYLPPECLTESQSGNLDWTTRMSTSTSTDVSNSTSQTSKFTVPAGNFQCINITLTLTGMDFGTLTFMYDVASGILVFEQWVPSYGDIITLSLTAENATLGAGSVLLDLILPIAVLAIPAAMGIDKASNKLRRRRHRPNVPADGGAPRQNFDRVIYINLTGALFSLASVFVPWGQLLGIPMYLPLSLQLLFLSSATLLTPEMLTVSFMAHAAAILAWTSLALQVYKRLRLTPRLLAIVSGALAFIAASVFIGTGWTLSWGTVAIVVAGIFAITGAIAVKAKR